MLLDGFPRTALQVELWGNMMAENLPSYQMRVVPFELSSEVIVERLSQRLVCANTSCQKSLVRLLSHHHVSFVLLLLVRRPDDEPDVIRKRLSVYADHEAALLAAYDRLGLTIERFDVEHVALDDMFAQFNKLLNNSQSAVEQ